MAQAPNGFFLDLTDALAREVKAFTDFFQPPGTAQTLQAFQATFACMGLITVASAGIFWQLSPQDRSGTQAGASVDAGDHG